MNFVTNIVSEALAFLFSPKKMRFDQLINYCQVQLASIGSMSADAIFIISAIGTGCAEADPPNSKSNRWTSLRLKPFSGI